MNDAGQKDTKNGRKEWENELWSYLAAGDGVKCPLQNFCLLKSAKQVKCFNDLIGTEYLSNVYKFVDNDSVQFPRDSVEMDPTCFQIGRVFELVFRLAEQLRDGNWDRSLPVPDNLIIKDGYNFPIEIRYIPLKAHHGAIWRLEDCWLIHLNKNDASARKRFTLYHEVFHILAHGECSPVFNKTPNGDINFNEVLADHFAANILLPRETVAAKWAETKDVSRMAAIFDVPRPIMYMALKIEGLV